MNLPAPPPKKHPVLEFVVLAIAIVAVVLVLSLAVMTAAGYGL